MKSPDPLRVSAATGESVVLEICVGNMKPLKSYIAYVPMFELEILCISTQAIWNFMGPVSQVLILRNLGV